MPGHIKLRHPLESRRQQPLYRQVLLSPVSVGILSAAASASLLQSRAVIDRFTGQTGALGVVDYIVRNKLLHLACGFVAGYGACKSLGWLRLVALRKLLAYQDWVVNPKSTTTKVWGLLLKLIKGSGPYSSYEFQRCLPNQPLPPLDVTLDKWLEMSKNLLSEEEFACTKQAVESFRSGDGPRLQQHLEERARREVNWLSEYWLNAAYLAGRGSIAVNSNYFDTWCYPEGKEAPDLISRAASQVALMAEYAVAVEQEKCPPQQLMDLVPLCMNALRYLFNTCRVPGENIDSISRFPGERHVIVMVNGQYFVLDPYAPTKNKTTRKTLSAAQIKRQLARIQTQAKETGHGCDVAALTAQDRTSWAKHRARLLLDNAETLYLVESAMFILCLDDDVPEDLGALSKRMLAGSGSNRWFDKSFTAVVMGDGRMTGHNVEHSVVDATVFVEMTEFMMVKEQSPEYDVRDVDVMTSDADLPMPRRLSWQLSGIQTEIDNALSTYRQQIDKVEYLVYHTPYGKGFMKSKRLSPDGYMQMTLQLAYYRMYKSFPKTYEPSTSRMYALGRTETIHVASEQSKAWVKSMDDSSVDTASRIQLLRQAIRNQTAFRTKATVGQGADRHMVGLFIASRELGMDVPQVFLDKAWSLPYHLSTSQTPSRIYEYGPDVDFRTCNGGFGPYCPEAYGLSYCIHGEDIINVLIGTWKYRPEMDAGKLAAAINTALIDMKEMLQNQ